MISRINGRVLGEEDGLLVVDVNGVGYDVEVPTTSLATLATQPSAELFTHLVVREESQALFGFETRAERDLFRALIKINGVGPKLALTLLSDMRPSELALHVTGGDVARLTKVAGVGKKTAERLVVELKDRLGEWLGSEPVAVGEVEVDLNPESSLAVAALVALGYKDHEARRMVENVAVNDLSTEEIVRSALRNGVSEAVR